MTCHRETRLDVAMHSIQQLASVWLLSISASCRVANPMKMRPESEYWQFPIDIFYFEALVVVSGFLRVVTGEGNREPTGPVNSSLEPSS